MKEQATGLVYNETTNRVENKFSVRTNMLPKHMSSTRGSAFSCAVSLSALRISLGHEYVFHIFQNCTSEPPSKLFTKHINKKEIKSNYYKEYQNQERAKRRRRVKKQQHTGATTKSRNLNKKPDDDIPLEEIVKKINEYKLETTAKLTDALNCHKEKCDGILQDIFKILGICAASELQNILFYKSNLKRTAMINQNEEYIEWKRARRGLLTASHFGAVISKKPKTSCASLVDDIICDKDISNLASVNYGLEHEKDAIAAIKIKHPNLHLCDNLGLFQKNDKPYLAATPDALAYDPSKPKGRRWGVVEIKCPISAKDGLPQTAQKGKLITEGGLKKAMHITDRFRARWPA